jgi:hypothetical protein
MGQRHRMLSITYNWETERPLITYNRNFEDYSRIEKLDSLSDVIGLLTRRYEHIIATTSSYDD